jgi:hypothetical protein
LFDDADARGAGRHAPWEPALGSILVDVGLHGAKAFVAAEAIVSGPTCTDESEGAITDPLRTRVAKHRVDGRGNLGGFVWQCTCGVLSGADFAGEHCSQCRTDVVESVAGANRWVCDCGAVVRTRHSRVKCESCGEAVRKQATSRRDLARVELSLPTAVVHPWRFDEAAALLGLTRNEFEELVTSHGPMPVLEVAEAALEEAPTAAVRERMAREDDSATLRALGKCLFKLQNWCYEGAGQLSLSAVPVVPSRFLMCGLVPGAPTFVHGGLLEQYRDLRRAIEQAEQLANATMPALRTSVGIALQEAVQSLYGDCERTSDRVDSLADLVGRIWPVSRSPDLDTVVPGLCLKDGVLSFQSPSRGDEGENEEGVAAELREEAVGAVPLTLPRLPTIPISSPDYWTVRYAQVQLNERLLAPIAGLFSELSFARLDSASRERLELLGVEDTDELSLIAAREVLRSLDRHGSRPDQLLLLFECKLPVPLPSDPEPARARLMERLERALPSSDVGSAIAREVLAYILGGWWKATPTPTNPLGWRRESPEQQLESPWTRAVPPLRSSAWALWQGMGAFSNPVRWLLGREPRTAYLSNAVGKYEFLPRQPWWDERERVDSEQPELVRESIGEEAATASPEQVPVASVLEGDVSAGGAVDDPQAPESDVETVGREHLATSAESDLGGPIAGTFARVLRGDIETWLSRAPGQAAVRLPQQGKSLNLKAGKLEGGTG